MRPGSCSVRSTSRLSSDGVTTRNRPDHDLRAGFAIIADPKDLARLEKIWRDRSKLRFMG